jgi:hypothetical protein
VDLSRPVQTPVFQTPVGEAQVLVLSARPSAAQAPSFQASPGVDQASVTVDQRWANLDQASKHLEVFRFRDLSPTPKP